MIRHPLPRQREHYVFKTLRTRTGMIRHPLPRQREHYVFKTLRTRMILHALPRQREHYVFKTLRTRMIPYRTVSSSRLLFENCFENLEFLMIIAWYSE
jgi:hypothetical protein